MAKKAVKKAAPRKADLIAKAEAVRSLADELPDPDELEDGEQVVCSLDTENWTVLYSIQTGQNGYAYDTHQYCTALIITERDEEASDTE